MGRRNGHSFGDGFHFYQHDRKKNKCLCGVSRQVLPEVKALRRILNILEVCGRTQVAVTV